MRRRLAEDLQSDFDYAIHLGQAPGAAKIRLEAIGLNVAPTEDSAAPGPGSEPLVLDGPVAYQTALPLGGWAEKLRRGGIPTQVSYHAGTYLCNATLYLSQYLADHGPRKTQSVFIHLPLELSQVIENGPEYPAWPRATLAAAVRLILDELAGD
jgi:pyroglutamyl-peptidase